MRRKRGRWPQTSNQGFSLIELTVVMAVAAILTAMAIPQMISMRRLTRSSAVPREIMTRMRYTRQLAMSKRQAYTFQYDDAAKWVNIIGPIPGGVAALADPNYPNNTGSTVVLAVPLTQGGLPSGEINCGIPTTSTGLPSGAPTIPTGALDDGVSQTSLTNNKLNITFQPDGSVMDTAGLPLSRAMFIFNNRAAQGTASAISVLGATGRVKVWRYSLNGNKYVE